MKRLTVILAILAIAFAAKAERVSYKDAEKVARAYYYQTVNAFRATAWDDINLSCVVNPNDAKPMYNLYIFDVNGGEGYIVVSTDDQIKPVLAYSFESAFNADNMSPGRAAYLNYYSESNDYAASNVCENAAEARKKWADLLAYNPSVRATRDVLTSPLLLDGIVWEQGWPFNSMCPTKPSSDSHSTWGTHNHAYVGCVATATCHVMKYWNWPSTGTGYITHRWCYNGWNSFGGYQDITVNFANQTYNWYAVADDPGNAENEELGKICYHVGVAVKMNWQYDGSGSHTEYVESALRDYFKYASDIQYVVKRSYSDANWRELLRSQIDKKYPVVYSGLSTSTGHAWNCDGYQINENEETFHMRWGWGLGDGSGFYTLDELISTATEGGSENNFNLSQDAVINIHPDVSFSECQDVEIVCNAGSEGTFDDGSRIYDYANNKNCTYVINPTCGSYIELDFPRFDLAEGDYLNVFAGDESSNDLIATFDADNLPDATIKNTSGALTLKFHSDGSGVADGWRATYAVKSKYCLPRVVLTSHRGVFGDGSKACEYKKNTTCEWWIDLEDANSVTFSFSEFDISSDGSDFVAFYRNIISDTTQVVKYNSDNIPSEPITISGSKIIVKFYSNSNNEVGDGWLLSYASDNISDIRDVEIMSNLNVVPNPANDDARITFTLTDVSNTTITITNMLGQVVGEQKFELQSGYHEISFKDFSNLSLQNQMYFVTLQNENQIKTCKFLFTE